MATYINSTIATNASDAAFRAWVQMFYDGITTVSWVQTADTGQLAVPITATAPVSLNVVSGYLVFKPSPSDPSQSTVPIFLKIEFGSAGAASLLSIWITVGTSTDGAGNITANASTRTRWSAGGAGTVTSNSYFSGDGTKGRLTIAPWVDTNVSGFAPVFVIDRIPDSSGANTTAGFTEMFLNGSSTCYTKSWQNNAGFINVVPDDTGIPAGFPKSLSTGVVGNFACVFTISPMIGYEANPILGAVAMYATDIGQSQSFDITIYGTVHTYLSTKSTAASDRGGSPQNNTVLCILWE